MLMICVMSEPTFVQPAAQASAASTATQQVVKVRRDYNSWVGRETLEDHALRFAPQRSRRWPTWQVANTAFGAASFLVLEAVGATLLVQYGFTNAVCAILVTGLIIFLAGLPISVYAARYGVDMDLLTRAVAADQLLRQRALVTGRLRQAGIDVIEAPHDRIDARLIDAYLSVKRKGAIA